VELYFWTTYLGQRLRLSRTELLSLYSVSRFKYRALPSLEGSGREDRIHTSTHYRWAHDGQYDQRKVVKALICLVPAESFFVPMRRKLSYKSANNGIVPSTEEFASLSLSQSYWYRVRQLANNAIVSRSDEAVPSVSRPSQRPVSRYI